MAGKGYRQSCSPKAAIPLAPRNRDLWEESEGEPALSHSGFSLYACSATVIELERMECVQSNQTQARGAFQKTNRGKWNDIFRSK